MSNAGVSTGTEEEARAQGELISRGFRLVAGLVRVHWLPFTAAVLGSAVFATGTALSAVMLGWLTDDIVLPAFGEAEAGRSRTMVVTVVLVIAVFRSAGVVCRRYFAGMTSFRTKNDLQRSLGLHYLKMDPSELRVAPKGRLLAHVDSDTEVAIEAMGPLPFTVGVITLLGVSIVSLALVDWTLMAVALAMVPLIIGLNRLNARLAEGPAVEVREAVAQVSNVASESFDGALIVKTLGRESTELERFSVEADELRIASIRLGKVRAIFASLLDLIPDVCVIVLVVVGAWRVSQDVITTGQLVQGVALFGVLVFPLKVIGFFMSDLPPSVIAHDRITAMLAGRTVERTGRNELPGGALGIDVAGLSVHYDDAVVVDDVSLTVAPGEVVAIVGPTGSGKSTLLSALLHMVPLASGSIEIGGSDVADLDPASLSRRVAIGWQESFLLDASVSDNIAFGARPAPAEIEAAAELARFASVAADLAEGYNTRVGERGVLLSGGQRQRLALARALVRRPGLLLLDDATSAIDPSVEEDILDGIRGINTTMVIVAHRRSTIMLADRVVLLHGGRVLAAGTHDDLLEVPQYVSLLEAYDIEASS